MLSISRTRIHQIPKTPAPKVELERIYLEKKHVSFKPTQYPTFEELERLLMFTDKINNFILLNDLTNVITFLVQSKKLIQELNISLDFTSISFGNCVINNLDNESVSFLRSIISRGQLSLNKSFGIYLMTRKEKQTNETNLRQLPNVNRKNNNYKSNNPYAIFPRKV